MVSVMLCFPRLLIFRLMFLLVKLSFSLMIEVTSVKSRKFTNLIISLFLGVGVVFATSTLVASAADSNDAGSYGITENDDYSLRYTDYTGNGATDFEPVINTDSNGYYETIYFSTDIYLPYSLRLKNIFNDFKYNSGIAVIGDRFTVSGSVGNSFTLDQLTYNVSLVYSDNDVMVGLTDTGNGSFIWDVTLNDVYANMNSTFSWTACIHCTGRAIYSGSTYRNFLAPTITISHTMGFSNYSSLLSSDSPKIISQFSNGLDDSLAIQAIDSHTSQMNDKLGYLYDRLGVTNQQIVTTNGLISTGNGLLTTGNDWLRRIYNDIHTDDSDAAATAQDSVDTLAGMENSASTGVSNLMTGIADDTTFNNAVSDISSLDTQGFYVLNMESFHFWHDVGNWFLDRNNIGILASFFMIVLVVGFITWVLAL